MKWETFDGTALRARSDGTYEATLLIEKTFELFDEATLLKLVNEASERLIREYVKAELATIDVDWEDTARRALHDLVADRTFWAKMAGELMMEALQAKFFDANRSEGAKTRNQGEC